MYQAERLEQILDILKHNGYVTVKFLVNSLHYSTATINRDLSVLENRNLIKRSYGGVELKNSNHVPLEFRYHKMKSEKNLIAKKASSYIDDDDTIFIDGSTTCQYICKHLHNKKNITVISNNMSVISYLSARKINAVCLGGVVTDPPYVLSGIETLENASKYNADKLFFSTNSFDDNGKIGTNSNDYYLLHRTMVDNSNQVFFLADSGKHNQKSKRTLFNFSEIDYIISDYAFSSDIVQRYQNTNFIHISA